MITLARLKQNQNFCLSIFSSSCVQQNYSETNKETVFSNKRANDLSFTQVGMPLLAFLLLSTALAPWKLINIANIDYHVLRMLNCLLPDECCFGILFGTSPINAAISPPFLNTFVFPIVFNK